YYSFYCWVVELFERTAHSDNPVLWAKCIRRAEALYAVASYMHEAREAHGLGGGIWAAARRREIGEGKAGTIRPFVDHREPLRLVRAQRQNDPSSGFDIEDRRRQ